MFKNNCYRFLVSGVLTALSVLVYAETIRLKFAEFDPLAGVPRIPLEWSIASHPGANLTHCLVQFESPKTSDDDRDLELIGARALVYVPTNTWVVEAPELSIRQLRALPRVRWAGMLEPAFKLSPELGRRSFQSLDRIAERVLGVHRATVTLFDGKTSGSVAAQAARSHLEVLAISPVGPRLVFEVRGSMLNIQNLAWSDDVEFIEEATESIQRNDITCWVIQSNSSGQTPIWSQGIHGENQVAGLIDGALYKAHNCFNDPTNGNIPGPTHRKIVAYFSSSGQNGGDTHGTHTAGTLGGDQSPITGSTYRNGIAYKNKIAFTNLADNTSSNLYAQLVAMHNVGARDFSNSWGDDGTTAYTSHCQQIDQFSYDFEDDVVAFAVTNTSTLKTPENAKSVLAVGNTSQSPNQGNASTGGTGPTSDGRRKPEIWAPGTSINSARSGTTNQWTSLTGTSMACPAITGAAQLVRQYYREGWLGGGKPGHAPSNPSGALIRATLMNGGVDMAGLSGYPGVREGWGRLLLDNVLWFAGEARRTLVQDVRRSFGLSNGGERTFSFSVVDPAVPLRITMSFTDYPAAALTSFAPVNNVDMTVTAPGGVPYLGNQINTASGQSVTGGTADAINSTEMVLLNTPPKGTYTVKIKATSVVQGGTQGYALVVNGGVRAFSGIP